MKIYFTLFVFCIQSYIWAQNSSISDAKMFTINSKPNNEVIVNQYYSINQANSFSTSLPTNYVISSHNSIYSVSMPIMYSILNNLSNNTISNPQYYKLGKSEKSELNSTIQVQNQPILEKVKQTQEVITINKKITVKKRALVIGNGKYSHSAELRNPINDANAMEITLKQLGFDVIKENDIGIVQFQEVLKSYVDFITDADVSLFYFAGHGMQVDNKNYLLPIDANIASKDYLPFEAINVDLILSLTDNVKSNRLNIVILDACRNNPFLSWSRGGESGLSAVSPPSGTVIAYSTSPNSVASDGSGKNGLYTGELIKQLMIPQRIEDVFINTRIVVEDKSNRQQSPWELARLRGIYNLHE